MALQKEIAEKSKSQLTSVTEALQKERESSAGILKQRVDQIAKLIAEVDELKNRSADLEERFSTVRATKDDYQNQNKDLTKRMAELEEKLSKEKESTVATFSEELEAKKAALAKAAEDIKIMEKDLALMEQNLNLSAQKREQLTNEVTTKEQELKTVNDKLRQVIQDKEVMNTQHIKEVDRLNQQLKEKEEEIDRLNKANAELRATVEDLQKQLATLESEKQQLVTDLEQLKKTKEEKEVELSKQIEESNAKITELNTAVEDSKMEQKLIEKKCNQKVKDLQEQLVKERKTFDKQLHQASSSFSSFPNTPEKVLKKSPSFPNLPQKSTPQPVAPPTPTPLTPSKIVEVPVEVLQEDINQLATLVGELQTEKWKLEEAKRHLEDTVNLLSEELQKKEIIIQHHALTSKVTGRSTPEMDAHKVEKLKKRSESSGVMKNLFGPKQDITAEMTEKDSEAVLEDTILKNIQLPVRRSVTFPHTAELINLL